MLRKLTKHIISDLQAASESYLAMDKIIDTANRVGAEAIHPGYGFLSENESFAEAARRKGSYSLGQTVRLWKSQETR